MTAFDCVSGPHLAVIGRMFFFSAQRGCIVQVQSSYPMGIYVDDCQMGHDQILPGEGFRLGRICVGMGGADACDPSTTAVEPATWGGIKAQVE